MSIAAPQNPGTNLITVAIVDDHQLVLDGLEAVLRHSAPELHVVAAESSWAALIDHPRFPFDVVVLDLHLADNIPIATKVRAIAAAGSATVIMSRHADSGSVHAAMDAGALGFVPKSDSADELIAAITAAVAKRPHVSDDLASALAEFRAIPDAGLGKQEQRSLVLYASGRTIKEVAAEMATTEETVKSYIKRARRKYRRVGIDLGTRVLLRRHGIRAGWVSPD